MYRNKFVKFDFWVQEVKKFKFGEVQKFLTWWHKLVCYLRKYKYLVKEVLCVAQIGWVFEWQHSSFDFQTFLPVYY